MQDPSKTNQELSEENSILRQRIQVLEKAEEALQESIRHLKLVLEGTDQGLWEWDILSRKVVYDENWPRIMNLPSERRCVDMDQWLASMDAEGRAAFEINMTDYLAGRMRYYEIEHRLLTENKEWKWIWTRGIATERDSSGIPLRMIGTYRDVTKQKQAEEAWKESEGHFRALAEYLPETIFETDLQGKLTFVNRNAFNCFRYTPQDYAVGINIHNLIHPDDRGRAMENIQKIMCGEDIGLNEYKLLRKDGSVFPAMSHSSAILSNSKPVGLRGFIIDMTEPKRAEEALRESESRAKGMLRAIPDMMFRMNSQGIFLDYKADITDLYVQSEPTLIGKRNRDITPPEFADLIDRQIRTALETGKLQTFEYQLAIPVRGLRDYEARLVATGEDEVTAIVRDVTDRIRAEEELKKSDEMLRLITDNMSDMIRVSDLQGSNLYVSPSHLRGLGYKPEDRVDKSGFDIVHPDDVETIINKFAEGLAGNKPMRVEYRVRHADGHYLWLETAADLLRDDQGKATAVVMSSRDISARRQAEEALRESEEKYRSLYTHSTLGIFHSTLDGKFTDVNPSLARMMGYNSPEEAVRSITNISEQVYAEPPKRNAIATKALEAGGFVSVENCYRRKDGTLWYGMLHLCIICDQQGRPSHYEGFIEDITERKQVEDALKLHSAVLETVAEGIFLIGLEDNIIRWTNRKFEELFGYDPGEMVGMHVDKVNAPTEISPSETRISIVDVLRQNGEWHGEIMNIKKDGTLFWSYIHVSLFNHPEFGTVMVSAHTDITERKRAEETLKQSEQRWATTLASIGDAVIATDQLGNITFMNNVAEKLTGWVLSEVLREPATKVFNIVNEQEGRKVEDPVTKILRDEAIVALAKHTLLIRKDGLEVPIDDSGAPIKGKDGKTVGVVLVFRDITEKKRVDEVLQTTMHRLHTVVSSVRGAILLVGEGRVALVNQSFCDYFELQESPTDLTGLTPVDVIEKIKNAYLDPDEQISRIQEITALGHLVVGEEIAMQGGRTCLRDFIPIFVDGKSYGRLWHHTDITSRKRAEAEKRNLEERLNRAEKMESLGTLAGGVAHDLNNVLGIVVGYAEMLIDEMDEANPMRDDLKKILEGGNRSAAIVQDLLTLARRGVQTKKTVNLNATITDCQKLPEFEKIFSRNRQVNLQTDFESDLLNIIGSPVHLFKSIINLVANAVEAMPNGGVLKIATANQYLDVPIHGYDKIREGDYVVLTVSDTGEGIPARDIKRIFEPFYTKKIMGRSGTGLGLAVVWGTIKDHNGYINVESIEGRGSTFTLYFPVTRKDMESEQTSVSMSEYMGNDETILIVDDINRQRELASRMLTKLNYSVNTVASGEEAIEYLKANKADLIVLDMIMEPGIDGLETYENILKLNPVQKAVIVSGFSESDRVKEAQRMGAGAYVPKPYVLERLGIAVRKELDRK